MAYKEITLEELGADPYDSAKDQYAFATAIEGCRTGRWSAIKLGARTYYVTGVTINGFAVSLTGCGHNSVLQTSTNAAVIIVRNSQDSFFADFRIVGSGSGSSQNGIEIGYLGSDGSNRCKVSNITGYNLGGSLVVTAYEQPLLDGPEVSNCSATLCGRGFTFAGATTGSNLQGTDCGIGISCAGNVNIVGGDFSQNDTGFYLDSGGNDSHGSFTGTQFRHNGKAGQIEAIANGMFFNNCLFYEGELDFDGGNTGVVVFNGGAMDLTTYTLVGAARFNHVMFDLGYFSSATTTGGKNKFVECYDIDGTIPAWIQSLVQNTFSFAADANETCTDQKAYAETLIVTDGSALQARELTIPLAANPGVKIRVINNGSFNHTVKLATGTAVTINAGTWALVGASGGNAIKLES